ncbi:MAG: 4Fe-4S binding protein [Desulfotignum sp.]|nr:4Fe-4S binding protein [Desulfotignum sp.]
MKTMTNKKITLVYFSPTATTKTVLDAIAKGTGYEVDSYDITLSGAREKIPQDLDASLIVFGAPVYSGRVPKLAADCFKRLSASKIPAVPVVVYGNREYDDALLELKDISVQCGCTPIAAGAFIGEHSFSTQPAPIAPGRPDEADLACARTFGEKIARLLETAGPARAANDLMVPGNVPYKKPTVAKGVPFIDVTDDCVACGTCVQVCPVDAVDEKDGFRTLDDICIHCCACIKACPQSARIMKNGPFKDISVKLNQTCGARKEPETFFAGAK